MSAPVEFDPPEGVHLGLPDQLYFQAPAIGSSDLKTLLRDPASWWYSSRHNPSRHGSASKEAGKRRGGALHTLILEGEGAYKRRYAIEPAKSEHPDAAVTAAEIKALLQRHNIEPPKTVNKDVLIEAVRKAKLGHLCWDVLVQNFKNAEANGYIRVNQREDFAFRHMAALAHNHPQVGPALKDGLTEVSVFWRRPEDPHTLLRARLDKISPRFTADLKTLSNWRAASTRDATKRQIVEMEYDIQRRFYDEAREQLRRFVDDGAVHGWDDHGNPGHPTKQELKQLEAIADADTWRWVWVFYQVRNDEMGKERAPVLIPWFHEPAGQAYEQAAQKVERALKNYRLFREVFGFDEAWAEIGDVVEIEDKDLSGLMWKGLPE